MRRAWRRAGVLLPLLSLLAACAGVTPAGAPGAADPAADLLLGRLWTTVPGVWRIRQSVLFEGHGMSVPLQGFLELDTARRRARLAGLDDLGITLFTVTVTPGGMETDFFLPGPGRREDLTAVVASGVRRVYLEPLPERTDTLSGPPQKRRMYRRSGARETDFTFDQAGILLAAEVRGDGESWRVEYGAHREVAGLMVPGTIVLADRTAGYRLSITQDEMRRTE